MILQYILMSLRDLWRRKGRSILTSLGITIGTLLIITMVGLGTGVEDFIYGIVNSQDNGRIITIMPMKHMTEDDLETLDYADYESYIKIINNNTIQDIEKTNFTETVIGSISGSTDILKIEDKEYGGIIQFVGYNKGANLYTNSVIENVRYKSKDDTLEPIKIGNKLGESSGEILIGEKVLEQINISAESAINKEIEISVKNDIVGQYQGKKFKIVGVIDKNFANSGKVVMGAKDAAELRGYQVLENDYLNNNGYDTIQVYANDITNVEELSEKIKDLGYLYVSSVEMAKEVEESLGAINIAFVVLGVIVLFVSAIGIVNTMTMSVIERTKSIGVMKSVGANKGAIRTMFLVQSSLIGFIGGSVGILVGLGVNKLVEIGAMMLIEKQGINASITIGLPWYLVVLVLVFSLIIALISGIYPANRAAKLDTIEALRR